MDNKISKLEAAEIIKNGFIRRFGIILKIGYSLSVMAGIINYLIRKEIGFAIFSMVVVALCTSIFLIYYLNVKKRSAESIAEEIGDFEDMMKNAPTGSTELMAAYIIKQYNFKKNKDNFK